MASLIPNNLRYVPYITNPSSKNPLVEYIEAHSEADIAACIETLKRRSYRVLEPLRLAAIIGCCG